MGTIPDETPRWALSDVPGFFFFFSHFFIIIFFFFFFLVSFPRYFFFFFFFFFFFGSPLRHTFFFPNVPQSQPYTPVLLVLLLPATLLCPPILSSFLPSFLQSQLLDPNCLPTSHF